MSFVKGALLAASFAMLAIAPAAAEALSDSIAMVFMMDGQHKTVKVTGMPKGAKEMKSNMAVVMMNGKMWLVDLGTQQSFTFDH